MRAASAAPPALCPCPSAYSLKVLRNGWCLRIGSLRLSAHSSCFWLHRNWPRRFCPCLAPYNCGDGSNMVRCSAHHAACGAALSAFRLLMRTAMGGGGYRRLEWKCDLLNSPSARAALRWLQCCSAHHAHNVIFPVVIQVRFLVRRHILREPRRARPQPRHRCCRPPAVSRRGVILF